MATFVDPGTGAPRRVVDHSMLSTICADADHPNGLRVRFTSSIGEPGAPQERRTIQFEVDGDEFKPYVYRIENDAIAARLSRAPQKSYLSIYAEGSGEKATLLVSPQFIGQPDGVVRAINFSGGAFDAVMQLGVIHALLVIEGKGPDVVTGLSAGAVNAAALAEVMQAGEKFESTPWEELTRSRQREVRRSRTIARVARFREILDRFHRAVEELSDHLLPDTYQIETIDPLRVVETPFFKKSERARRQQSVMNRTGLARLYDELLRLRVTVGTATRIARRILGITAAAEVRRPRFFGRLAVRAVEYVRLWILIGGRLHRIASVVPFALGHIGLLPRVGGSSAGTLIFQFRRLRGLRRSLEHAMWYLLLVFLWLSVTLSVLLLPHHLLELLGVANLRVHVLVTALCGVVAIAAALPALENFEPSDRWEGERLVAKGVFGALSLVVLYVGAALALAFGYFCVAEGLRVGPRAAPEAAYQDTLGLISIIAHDPRWIVLQVTLLIALAVCPLITKNASRGFSLFRKHFLKRFNISASLFHPYALESVYAEVFDKKYYGSWDIHDVVDAGLKDRLEPTEPSWVGERRDGPDGDGRKYVAWYSDAARHPPIRVGLAVADLEKGRLEVVPPETTVVDGLVAATAIVPYFPPKVIGRRVYIDGTRLAYEPMQATLSTLRENVHPKAKVVHTYAVVPLPFSGSSLGHDSIETDDEDDDSLALDLVENVRRAWQLKRFQDATLERRLTELFTKVMPADRGSIEAGGRRHLRVWVTPVEPDRPLGLTRRMLRANRATRRRYAEETIADGCRAALEVMVAPSVHGEPIAKRAETIPCWVAVKRHLEKRLGEDYLANQVGLPGSRQHLGPGLPAICRRCTVSRSENGTERKEPRASRVRSPNADEGRTGGATAHGAATSSDSDENRCRIKLKKWGTWGPPWPHEREAPARERRDIDGDPHFDREPETDRASRPASTTQVQAAAPMDDGKHAPGEPSINLVFSGGVFRGVFQIGVVNALSELGAKPSLIAGASVGSLTGAMSATVFAYERTSWRRARIASLAAIHLALDRLVITDSLADSIRTMTVRAADAQFSLRQADRVFRRFDAPRAGRFEREARIVAAGLERLLYVSPFELRRFVEAVRDRAFDDIVDEVSHHAQEWLDRMDIGDEVLGAEPLRQLIETCVIKPFRQSQPGRPDAPPATIELLATATNITRRRLQIFRTVFPRVERPESNDSDGPCLKEALLASSAFPGLFRPRWSYEVFAGAHEREQYVDGGLMDNLPLDAVARHLFDAAKDNAGIRARPHVGGQPVPHLVLAASLQPKVHERAKRAALESWPDVLKRARELAYNRKVREYRDVERELRAIHEAMSSDGGDWEARGRLDGPLLDLEIVVVEPQWLCSTFGFHPMLGFRREKQARSIAHGCASTFLELARIANDTPAYVGGWGLDVRKLPVVTSFKEAWAQFETRQKRARKSDEDSGRDRCWLRPGHQCPFSRKALNEIPLPRATKDELRRIHELCSYKKTHRGSQPT